MKLSLERVGLRLLQKLLPLLVIIAMAGLRMVDSASWNAWTLHYEKHVLNSNGRYEFPLPFPDGHDRARMWLAREAISRGDIQKAMELVVPVVGLNNPLLRSVQALVLAKQGNFNEALQELIHVGDYNSLLDLSDSAASAGFPDKALDALHAAMVVDPIQGVLPIVVFLTNGNGDLVSAERILRNALATYPESSSCFFWRLSLADNLRRQERYDEAELIFQAALEENPDYSLTYIGLGWVYYERSGELKKAAEEFQRAIAVNELAGDGYYSMAQMLSREHRYNEADDWYRLALEHNPGNRYWIIGRANNARSAENYNLAISLYLDVTREYPDFPAPYYEIAWVYRLTENPAEAKRNIKKAISLKSPQDEYYYVRAGLIYAWDGENILALEAYQDALTINPTNSQAQQGIKLLDGQNK
jgi:tetratricopeptide (TPR) repeat protein